MGENGDGFENDPPENYHASPCCIFQPAKDCAWVKHRSLALPSVRSIQELIGEMGILSPESGIHATLREDVQFEKMLSKVGIFVPRVQYTR